MDLLKGKTKSSETNGTKNNHKQKITTTKKKDIKPN